MTTTPTDYDALARRYLDLWQQEVAKLAQDPQAAGAWATLFQGMMQNAATAWGQATAPLASAMTASSMHANATATPTANAPTRAAPAAAASSDGGLALADVLRRIDARLGAIEQRLAALEANPPARRRTRQSKS